MSQDSTTRIAAGLRAWIAAAPPGAQLPSNRALVAEYSASPVTVQKAMRTLIDAGLVESRPGTGTFVRAMRSARPADYGWQSGALGAPPARLSMLSSTQRSVAPDAIGLHSGYPASDLTARTNVPMPGRLSTSPASMSVRTAFCTVTGLAEYSATSARLDGSRAPGGAAAIQARRPAAMRVVLS